MANRTDPTAFSVHGKNPQYLIEKIVRDKIYNSVYWKLHCFALNAENLIDKAVDLLAVAGCVGGNRKPSPFLCLTLKLLQIQPEKEIVVEFITNEKSKYLRVLGAFYMRLTGRPIDVYLYLEPLLQDYRKVRFQDEMGKHSITHIDEVIHTLLTKNHYFNISLPSLPSRWALEKSGHLKPRESVLADLDDLEKEEHIEEDEDGDSENAKSRKEERAAKKEKKKKRIFTKENAVDGGRMESLSVDQTNKLREKLGLKKLV